MPLPSILLVDDDEVDAEAIQRAFQHYKIANPLRHAVDGLHALALLRSAPAETGLYPPYIILLDINMPRMNGLEFLRELRQDPDLKRHVVFVLTTSNSPQDRSAAYDAQVAGYILKQNVAPDFLQAIQLLAYYQVLVTLPD